MSAESKLPPSALCASASRPRPVLRRPALLLGVVVLAVHAAALAHIAAKLAPMIDETGHLAAGLSHWRFGTFDLYRVNPPLARAVAALPLLLTGAVHENWNARHSPSEERREFLVGRDLVVANAPRVMKCFTMARWACIPFSLLGAIVCWRWAHCGYGCRAGVLALVLWCSSPSVLAFGALLFPDLPAASLLLCAAYAFDRWLGAPSFPRAAVAGVALGLALLTKTTLMVCVPVWCLILASSAAHRAALGRRAAELALMMVAAFSLLNAGYLFMGTFQRLDQFHFHSRMMTGELSSLDPRITGNRFLGTPLGALRVPLPHDYVIGIDQQLRDFERPPKSYLLGRWQERGWWYYYLYGLAVKEPLSVLLLLVIGVVIRLERAAGNLVGMFERVPLITAVAILALVSSGTGFSHHLRYVFPIQGLVYVLLSRSLSAPLGADGPTAAVVFAGMAWSVLSSASAFPHAMSYFNELAGGPANGHRHMLFTSMDYGQDLVFLRDWVDRHAARKLDGICCFNSIDPAFVGLAAGLPPTFPAADGLRRNSAPQTGPRAGLYAVSVHFLCGGGGGVWLQSRDEPVLGRDYNYLASLEPVDRAGYSIWIFELTERDAARLNAQALTVARPP